MKTFTFLIAAVVFLAGIAIAQQAPPAEPVPAPALPRATIAKAFSGAWFHGTEWSLGFEFKQRGYEILDRKEMTDGLRKVAAEAAPNCKPTDVGNQCLLARNLDLAISVLSAIPRMGGDSLIELLGKPDIDTVSFARRGDSLCLLVDSLGTSAILNTLRLDPKQRAEKMVSGVLVPSLRAMSKVEGLDAAGISCIGVGVTYATKAFASNSPIESMTETEFVGAAGALSDVRSFASGELAEEELLGKMDVFSQDRSAVASVKKILLGVHR